MEKKQKNKLKLTYILRGLRNVLICDGIAAVGLAIIAIIFSLIKGAPIMKSIYMSYYYGGAAILLVSVPQLYKKNEDPKLRKSRGTTPLFGFYDWFGGSTGDETSKENFEKFKYDGFWLGIMMVFFSLVLFALAVVLETIFFV